DDDAFLDCIEQRFEKAFLARKLEHKALQTLRINPVNPPDEFIQKRGFHCAVSSRLPAFSPLTRAAGLCQPDAKQTHFQGQNPMKLDDVYKSLTVPNDSKLALVVLDALGDIATEETGFRTPLESARTPNLDALAQHSGQG